MVPRVADWVAGYAAGNPVHIDIVPGVPFVAASDAALMSPDKRLSAEELVDVKFQSLGSFQIGAVEVDIVGKGGEGGYFTLVRQVGGEFHIPQNIGECHGATDVK